MMAFDDTQSKTIDWLRFAMAVMVVFLHSFDQSIQGFGQGFSQVTKLLVSQVLCRVAVPTFFLISGYLFFVRLSEWDTGIWLRKIKRRLSSLVVPYIIWNILAFFVLSLYSMLRAELNGGDPVSLSDSLRTSGLLRIFWNSNSDSMPCDYPLWFVRDLIIYVAMTPFIFWLIKKCRVWYVLLLLILYPLGIAREGLVFFSIGSYLSINKESLIDVARRCRAVAYVTAPVAMIAATWVLYIYKNQTLFFVIRDIYVLSACAAILSLVSVFIEKGCLAPHPFLTKSSFFVFASHGILILNEISHYICLHLFTSDAKFMIVLSLTVKACLAVAICLGLYWMLSRFLPRTTAVLTGSRG